MQVTLFSTGCPKCVVLKQKLNQAKINYTEITDKELMISKGFMQVPMLEVDGEIMDFIKANEWIKERVK